MVGTFNGAQGFVIAQQGSGWYCLHTFVDEGHFRAWVRRTHAHHLVGATSARGRSVRGIDHRFNSEDDPEEGTQMQTNASQAQSQAARTATPAPAQSPLPGAQAKTLDLLARLTSSSEAQLEVLREMRAGLGIISGKLDLLIERTQAQPAAAPGATATNGDAAGGSYEDFDAEALTMGTDDNGKVVYKVRGGKYGKFGVRVWPEVLPLLGVDIDELDTGPNPFTRRVRVLLDQTGAAKKVVGLAK
jgi:hypothetical protein